MKEITKNAIETVLENLQSTVKQNTKYNKEAISLDLIYLQGLK